MTESLKAVLAEAGLDTSSLQERWPTQSGPIYTLDAPGAEAIALWRALRGLVDRTKHWPALLGDELSMRNLSYMLDEPAEQSVADLLAAASAIDVPAWLQEMLNQWVGEDQSLERLRDPGAWNQSVPPADTFFVSIDFMTGEPHLTIPMALLPTTESWQTPILLRYGGWNYCPDSEHHAALFRRWEEAYGAEVVSLAHDKAEMAVARPPTDGDAAIALALEQYAYCPDIVEQGTGSIDLLAAGLLHGSVWFFWWD